MSHQLTMLRASECVCNSSSYGTRLLQLDQNIFSYISTRYAGHGTI